MSPSAINHNCHMRFLIPFWVACSVAPVITQAQQASMTFDFVDHLNWGNGKVGATQVTETYSYDQNADVVTVTAQFNNGTFAPLPPMLALAKKYGFDQIQYDANVIKDTIPPYNSDLGPLMGADNAQGTTYQVNGLAKYVLLDAPQGSGTVPQSLTDDLVAEVDKILQAGHLAPALFLTNRPGWGPDRGQIYWLYPGDTLFLLSEILPAVPDAKKPALLTYLRSERTSYPPESIKIVPYTEGAGRHVFNPSQDTLLNWYGYDGSWAGFIYFRTHGQPKIWNLYGLARYYQATGEIPSATVLDACKTIVQNEMTYRDWASLYFLKGHWPEYNAVHSVNQLFAGLAGFIRLARLANDQNAEALGWGLFARMATLRHAMGKYTQFQYDTGRFTFPANQPDWWAIEHANGSSSWVGELISFNWTRPIDNVRQVHVLDDTQVATKEFFGWGAATGGGPRETDTNGQLKFDDELLDNYIGQYFLPFADLVPELGLFLHDFLSAESSAYFDRVLENLPHWYAIYAEAVVGREAGYTMPNDSHNLFLARAWVHKDLPEKLIRYIDIPSLAVGDLFYMNKLAQTIQAYRNAGVKMVETPTFAPPSGYFPNAVTVAVQCATPGAEIHVTQDGTDPTASSDLYQSPLPFTTTTTLKARGFLSGYHDSAVATGLFTITHPDETDGGQVEDGGIEEGTTQDADSGDENSTQDQSNTSDAATPGVEGTCGCAANSAGFNNVCWLWLGLVGCGLMRRFRAH